MHKLLYEKSGNARWISHLDMMHMMQRAFLRAGIAIKHSEGYHPHAYVSIALPLSVGQESVCEIMEFAVVDGTPLESIPAKLNEVFPDGLRAIDCYDSERKLKHLALLRVRVTLEYDNGAPDRLKIAELFMRDELIVEKKGKKGPTEVDIRPMIHQLAVRDCPDGLELEAVVAAQNPSLNPELLAAAIRKYLPDCAPDFVRVMRLDVLEADGTTFR